MNIETWAYLASLSSVVQTLIVVCATIYAVRQFKEATKVRHIEAFQTTLAELNRTEAIENRHFIYTQLHKTKPEQLPVMQRVKVNEVCKTFDTIGLFVELDLLPKEIIFPLHCDSILKTWDRVRPYVEYARKKRQNEKFLIHFEKLSRECKKYADENGVKIEIYDDTVAI